jgi:hypothetical protein
LEDEEEELLEEGEAVASGLLRSLVLVRVLVAEGDSRWDVCGETEAFKYKKVRFQNHFKI